MALPMTSPIAEQAYDGDDPAPPHRRNEIALTFDDLPAHIDERGDTSGRMSEVIRKLIAHLTASGLPATGFVNEEKLFPGRDVEGRIRRDGNYDETRVNLLEMWLDAGLTLGNHTFSHMSLHRAPSIDAYKNDILRGETVSAALLAKRGQRLRYFRHPYLETGQDWDTRTEVDAFLTTRGYRIAPVTASTQDYMYAAAYDAAIAKGDSPLARWVTDEYLKYMESIFEYFQRISFDLFGRNIRQTLLLHANPLNADHLDSLIQIIRRRGYSFIGLDEALRDPAYASKNSYIGPEGISWLVRWGHTQGYQCPHPLPVIPEFIVAAAFERQVAAERGQG